MIAVIIALIAVIFTATSFADQRIPVLMYHHLREVSKGMNSAERDLSCPPDVFLEHLNWIQTNGYTTVTFKDIANGKIVPKPIILTFDDGSYSHWYAFESLKKRNMVGVFFIVLGYIGKGRYLKEDQLRKMADCGMEIGSHGITHCDLTKVGYNRMEAEIAQSKKNMEDLFKTQIITFCYPFGRYNKAVIKVMEGSGYIYGRTTNEGISVFGKERNLELKIIYIHNYTRNLGKEIK